MHAQCNQCIHWQNQFYYELSNHKQTVKQYNRLVTTLDNERAQSRIEQKKLKEEISSLNTATEELVAVNQRLAATAKGKHDSILELQKKNKDLVEKIEALTNRDSA